MDIVRKSTPNFSVGRAGNRSPEIIVIHIMDGTLVGTDSWFAAPSSGVSAHYGIGKNGEVHQYVEEKDTAWHAGVVVAPTFNLYKHFVNPNSYTIGIEHEGVATSEWSTEMKQASAQLIREVCGRWGIPIDREHIIGHYQIRSTKPNCPATNKDIIDELIQLAKGVTIEPPQDNVAEAKRLLAEVAALVARAVELLNK